MRFREIRENPERRIENRGLSYASSNVEEEEKRVIESISQKLRNLDYEDYRRSKRG